MQEYQVTLEGETLALDAAVHGARDAEPDRHRRHLSAARGAARPLPVQDRDRLPDARAKRRRSSCATTRTSAGDQLPLDEREAVLDERASARAAAIWPSQVRVDERVIDYAVRIVRATRGGLGLAAGGGPRGAIALVRAARAAALIAAATSSRPTTSSAGPAGAAPPHRCSRPMRCSKAGSVDELLAGAAGDGRGAAPLSLHGRRPRCQPAILPTRAARSRSSPALAVGQRVALAARARRRGRSPARARVRGRAVPRLRRARLWASRRAWRAAPLRWQRRLPPAFAIGVRTRASMARSSTTHAVARRRVRPRRSQLRRRGPAGARASSPPAPP